MSGWSSIANTLNTGKCALTQGVRCIVVTATGAASVARMTVCHYRGLIVFTVSSVVVYHGARVTVAYLKDHPELLTRYVEARSTLFPDTGSRQVFRSLHQPEYTRYPGHGHGLAAAGRAAFDRLMSQFILSIGCDEFVISMAPRDARAGRKGTRAFYMAKDCAMESRDDATPDSPHVRKYVDVDMYANMPAEILLGSPILAYTFAPVTPAGGCADGVFSCADDEITCWINGGGGTYTHKIWDYSSDYLIVHHSYKTTWDVRKWKTSMVVSVDKMVDKRDPSRALVFINPVRQVEWLGRLLPGRTLERMTYSSGEWNSTKFLVENEERTELFHSFSRKGQTTSLSLPESVIDMMAYRCSKSKQGMLGSVDQAFRTLLKPVIEQPQLKWLFPQAIPIYAGIFSELYEDLPELLAGNPERGAVQHMALPDPAHYYVPNDNHILEDPKPVMRLLVPTDQAIVDGLAVPMDCIQNDIACVAGRIEKIRNSTSPPGEFTRFAGEFIRLLCPDDKAGTFSPVHPDELYERQARPSQRAILMRNEPWVGLEEKRTVASFMKRESYRKYTDPRNISTLPGDLKYRYSTVLYSVAHLFYTQAFYGFSKTPVEIDRRMAEVLETADFAITTDFSRFDGSHSQWLCEAELGLLKRAVAAEYHADVAEMYWKQYQTVGFTKHGVKYDTGYSRLSGSPETSLFNTFDNALVAYITLRRSGCAPSVAYDRLGFYGGDDGLTTNVSPMLYIDTAKKIGLTLTVDNIIYPGDEVPFLGRRWNGSWNVAEDLGSICHVSRQLSKFHATTAPDTVDEWIVLLNKATGLLLTDAHTPFVGSLCLAIVAECKARRITTEGHDLTLKQDQSWFQQWTDAALSFHQNITDDVWASIAHDLNTTEEHLRNCDEIYRNCKTGNSIAFYIQPHFNRGLVIEAKLPIVAGDLVIMPETPECSEQPQAAAPSGEQPPPLLIADTDAVAGKPKRRHQRKRQPRASPEQDQEFVRPDGRQVDVAVARRSGRRGVGERPQLAHVIPGGQTP